MKIIDIDKYSLFVERFRNKHVQNILLKQNIPK